MNELVKFLQRTVSSYYKGPEDGLWGNETEAAVNQFVKTKGNAKVIQKWMKGLGFYVGDVDGLWGPMSNNALLRSVGKIPRPPKVAWDKKVSALFVNKVISIADALDLPRGEGPSDMMSCMAWESGETFSPSILNGAGSGATGLIQFMPATAIAYFYTSAEIAKMTAAQKKEAGVNACKVLAKMTAEEQLDYVYKYFKPYKGKLKNLGDIYMAILWPKGIGKSDSWVLWDAATSPVTFRQNAGLDVNRDGSITRGECLVKIQAKKTRGLSSTFAR